MLPYNVPAIAGKLLAQRASANKHNNHADFLFKFHPPRLRAFLGSDLDAHGAALTLNSNTLRCSRERYCSTSGFEHKTLVAWHSRRCHPKQNLSHPRDRPCG